MSKGWLGDAAEWLGPQRGGGQGDREAQTRRQVDKRRLARAAALEAAGKPKSQGGRPQGPQGPQGGNHSKSNGGLPGKRPQYQKAAWMNQRLRGKQAPLGVTAYARAAHAKATHAKAVADNAKAVADDAKQEARCAAATKAEAVALVAAAYARSADAEARAAAAEEEARMAGAVAAQAVEDGRLSCRRGGRLALPPWLGVL